MSGLFIISEVLGLVEPNQTQRVGSASIRLVLQPLWLLLQRVVPNGRFGTSRFKLLFRTLHLQLLSNITHLESFLWHLLPQYHPSAPLALCSALTPGKVFDFLSRLCYVVSTN